MKQTKPTFVEGKQFTGGSVNGMSIVDWVRLNMGDAGWEGSYMFSLNTDGTGQQGWTEALSVKTSLGLIDYAIVGTWIVKNDLNQFVLVSSTDFVSEYDNRVAPPVIAPSPVVPPLV